MTVEQRLDALEAAVTRIEATLGDWTSPPVLSTGQLPTPLPNGRYNLKESDYQLHVALDKLYDDGGIIDQLKAQIAAIPASTPSVNPDVTGSLAALNIHVARNKVGIGMVPEDDDASALQIGGDAAACILGISNTKGTDGQNPGEVHKNTFVVADNDGGMRWRQYLQWVASGKKRNTTNRRASILALDSQGDLCKSTDEIGENSVGQSWYIRTSGSVVEFCTYKVGAFIRILKSVAGYGAADVEQL